MDFVFDVIGPAAINVDFLWDNVDSGVLINYVKIKHFLQRKALFQICVSAF